nr:hypothetical protein [Tanacetum cinerariifolium]
PYKDIVYKPSHDDANVRENKLFLRLPGVGSVSVTIKKGVPSESEDKVHTKKQRCRHKRYCRDSQKDYSYAVVHVDSPELDRLPKRSDEQEKRPVGLDHPFVSVIGDFVIAAFNEAREIHVKKGIHNNLHDLEFMECNYLKNSKGYYFYMTIEAIEEGNLAIYEAEVLCNNDDGSRTLSKFVLTDRTPVGLTDNIVVYILSEYRHRNAGLSLQRSLQTSHDKTMKDDWSDPSPDFYSGMVPRTNGTTCMGYDYYNPFDRDTLLIGTVGRKIPKDLYLLIKKAIAIRKHLETNKNDNDSKLKLISAERRIRYLARMHKNNKHLPRRWKYNPVTASTIFLTEKGCHQPPPLNPNRKIPNMYRVPLKDEDHKKAIEEGNLAIYEAEVLCNSDDGSRTLSKFVLTDRTPVGKKAMAISYLSRLRSICNAVEEYRHRNAGLSLQRSQQTSHDKTMK